MTRRNDRPDVAKGTDYDERWAQLEAAGEAIHGEADLVEALLAESFGSVRGRAVLDAGCGTGRVAVELARRALDVVGVDLDPMMLDTARTKSEAVAWHLADLTALDLGRDFDLIAAPGNVMIFLAPGTEGDVLQRLAAHLRPHGLLVAGFQLTGSGLSTAAYDAHATAAGLELAHRWATWERRPFDGGDYAVSVHRRGGRSTNRT